MPEVPTARITWFLLLGAAIAGALYPKFVGDGHYHFRMDMDLEGGVRLFYRVPDKLREEFLDTELDATLELCRLRLDSRLTEFYGSDPNVIVMGREGVLVEVPGIRNIREVLNEIGQARSVAFRGVLSEHDERPEDVEDVFQYDENGKWYVLDEAAVSGGDIEFDKLEVESAGDGWGISLIFTSAGAGRFSALAGKYFEKEVAILLDDEIKTVAHMQTRGGGGAILSGYSSFEDAMTERKMLASGPLPVSLELAEQQSAGPLFGESLRLSAQRGLALGVVLLFGTVLLAYWEHPAFLGVLFLTSTVGVCLLITVANLGWIVFSMTNAACAALLIGMNVDSQVIMFEDVLYRFRGGRQYDLRFQELFKPAFSVVFMGNLTTVIALGGLYFSEGVLRNYFILTVIGIAINSCCFAFAYIAMRDLAGTARHSAPAGPLRLGRQWINRLSELPDLPAFGPGSRVGIFMLVVPLIAALCYNTWNVPWGLELRGGTELELALSQPVDESVIHQTANEFFDDTCQLQRLDQDPPHFILRTSATLGPDQSIEPFLAQFEDRLGQKVEPVQNRAFSNYRALQFHNDFMVSVIAAILIMFLIFLFFYGAAIWVSIRVVVALAIDVSAVMLAVILFDISVSTPVVAAIVTIVGYSVNDSIIVAHKIVHHVREYGVLPPAEIRRQGPIAVLDYQPTNEDNVRTALKGVISRVLITTISTLGPIIGLLVLGEGLLRDYAIIMLCGLLSGTLTSYFVVGCRSVELGAKARYASAN